jgi:hypothetical protein
MKNIKWVVCTLGNVVILELVHDAVAIFKQIDLLILYQVSSRLVTCLNSIYASTSVQYSCFLLCV